MFIFICNRQIVLTHFWQQMFVDETNICFVTDMIVTQTQSIIGGLWPISAGTSIALHSNNVGVFLA